jgi:hypothetical protein
MKDLTSKGRRLPPEDAAAAFRAAADLAVNHIARRRGDLVVQKFDRTALVRRIAEFDFTQPIPVASAASELFDLLRETGVRTDHPRYFGLFNPPALVPGIVGDIVADTVNSAPGSVGECRIGRVAAQRSRADATSAR